MSVIKLTEDSNFNIDPNVGKEIVDLYVDAFKSKKVLDIINKIKKTNQEHGVVLKETHNGMGSGLYCGSLGMEKGTEAFLYYGKYEPEEANEDPTDQDYVLGIVKKTKKYQDGFEINGKHTTKNAYNAIWINHSCRKANVMFIKALVGEKHNKVYLVIGITTDYVGPGKQFLLNYNGEAGATGYWRPFQDMLKEYTVTPAGRKIINCLCEFPDECPFKFARIVKHVTEKERDAVQALLSLDRKTDTVSRRDIILPWSCINVKYSEFSQLDEPFKRLWLYIFVSITNKFIKASTCRGNEGFFGILKFVVPAENVELFNASQSAQVLKNACFDVEVLADGSMCFSHMPLVINNGKRKRE